MKHQRSWSRAVRFYFKWIGIWIGIVAFFNASRASAVNVSLALTQNAEPGGSVSYGIRNMTPSIFTLLLAPDGTQLRFTPVEGLTFSELNTRYFGGWTVREFPMGPAGPSTDYGFTFSPFSLDDLFHETPVVTTPMNGADVPASFEVRWLYPSGATPASRLIERINVINGAVQTTFAPTGFSLRLDVDRNLQGNVPIVLRVGTTSSLIAYISAVTPAGSNPHLIQASFRNLSLQTTVQVVPEPTTTILIGALAMLITQQRTRRRVIS
jgi:hypothetical protein